MTEFRRIAMEVKALYINLPVTDLEQTRRFWSELGFSFNEQFSDEKACCLVLQENTLYAMLITRPYFATFTNKPVHAGESTQVLLALQVDSRDAVDRMVRKALENGATRYRDGQDHGWMYYDCFADPDGHQWEIMHADPGQLQSAQ